MATTQQLTVTLNKGTSGEQDVTADATYESDDTAVATVSAGGLITAVGPGECTVSALYDGKTDTCAVVVESLTVEPSSIALDDPS